MPKESDHLTEKPQPESPWTTVSSREVYSNAWIRVREDQVVRPDGLPGIYGVVELKRAIGVIALTSTREIYLVGQFRYPLGVYSWEIIEGAANDDEGEIVAGRRELKEEAGVQAKTWRQLGPVVHLSNCVSNEEAYLFLATDLTEGEAAPEPVEVLEIRKVRLEEAFRMAHAGEITDAVSLIALARLERLERDGEL